MIDIADEIDCLYFLNQQTQWRILNGVFVPEMWTIHDLLDNIIHPSNTCPMVFGYPF